MRATLVVLLAFVCFLPARRGDARPARHAAATVALRTGVRQLADAPAPLVVTLLGHTRDADEEIVSVRLQRPEASPPPLLVNAHSRNGGAVFAVIGDGRVWLRRAAKDAGQPIEGEAYFPSYQALSRQTLRWRFSLPAPAAGSDAKLRTRYGQEAAELFRGRRSGAFAQFAAARLLDRYAPVPKPARPASAPFRGTSPDDIAQLMDTTTGMTSIQEALQIDRPLWLRELDDEPTVPIESLEPPPLSPHPFAAMLAALHRAVPEEKLAAATPAEFYYARVDDLGVFFRLADELDAWATPAVAALDGHREDHSLSDRTLTQLGLERTELARALGTTVVADLAVVGSDPYLREGSDVTVLFRVKQRALFDAALGGALDHHAHAHPLLSSEPVTAGGVTIHLARSADGAVRQHRATVGDLEIVSNSLAATRRVLAAIAGQTPRLSDEPDFQYMLARDAGQPADALFFLGDRFIAAVIGPRQKVLEARRQEALSELLVPGYAALLYGWVEGHTPASTDALVASGWLRRDELRHARPAGAEGAISFTPGRGARSAWGTPSALEPLYELPAPTRVTKAEQAAYQRFAQGYQYHWRQYIDPVAVRMSARPDGAGTRLVADVRVLPLIDGTDYSRLHEMAGRATLAAPVPASGMRVSVGIGAESRMRREASELVTRTPLGGRITLDWLDDWALLGVEDQPETARAFLAFDGRDLPQAPGDHDDGGGRGGWEVGRHLPVYAGIGIRNTMGAALFLAAGKQLVAGAAPGTVTWAAGPPYKGQATVHIAFAGSDGGEAQGGDVWYALTRDALVFTLTEQVLHHVLDERKGGHGTHARAAADAPQLVLDWGSGPAGALRELAALLLEAEAYRTLGESRSHAEVFLRGAPGADLRAIALAYEGAEPTPPDGGHYTLAVDGVRDPARGSAVLDAWPAIPVPGSPVGKLLAAVQRFRGELSIDDEPRLEDKPIMRSLHARVTLGLSR